MKNYSMGMEQSLRRRLLDEWARQWEQIDHGDLLSRASSAVRRYELDVERMARDPFTLAARGEFFGLYVSRKRARLRERLVGLGFPTFDHLTAVLYLRGVPAKWVWRNMCPGIDP